MADFLRNQDDEEDMPSGDADAPKYCDGVAGSVSNDRFAMEPDRRSRRLALYENGLNYCNTKSSPCCVRITGWKKVTQEQFKEWELHTLVINQEATSEDFAILLNLIRANPKLVKLVAAACEDWMVLEVAAIAELKELELTYGTYQGVRCYTSELINHPSLSSVVNYSVSCPGQQFLTDPSFVKSTTQSLMCEAPGGVAWNCAALNHILKMFCDGSSLKSVCLLLDNFINVNAFKHLVLKDIPFKEEHLHGVHCSDYFTIPSSTGIGFIEWKPHEFHFQLLEGERALAEHKKFIVREFMLDYYSNVLENGNPLLYGSLTLEG